MEERKAESSERINEYIRIGKPGIILLIISLALVLGAILIWGFTGKLYETIPLSGIVDIQDAFDVRCFADADRIEGEDLEGRDVMVKMPDRTTSKGIVISSSESPKSQEELSELFGYTRWEMNHLVNGTYFYVIEIDTQEDLGSYQGELVEVSVIMNAISPISFLIR